MAHSHAVVWMDSKEAHTFCFNATEVEASRTRADLPFGKIHHRAGAIGSGHQTHDAKYFKSIAETLAGVREWLLTGPGEAKLSFCQYLKEHFPALERTMVAVETTDHPTDRQVVALARQHFKAIDRMRAL